jgi:hypothetical protein
MVGSMALGGASNSASPTEGPPLALLVLLPPSPLGGRGAGIFLDITLHALSNFCKSSFLKVSFFGTSDLPFLGILDIFVTYAGRFLRKRFSLRVAFSCFFAGFIWGGGCSRVSDMRAVIINVLVRLGRSHAWMGVVYHVCSRVHVSLIYFLLVFLRCIACILLLLCISRLYILSCYIFLFHEFSRDILGVVFCGPAILPSR